MRRVFFLFFCFFFVSSSFAQTITPKMINLQAVLTDEGGNILYDKQESTMTFQILDGAGQVLYEEEKFVVIHKGTMSVLVGSGNVPGTNEPTGGIPPEVLKPDGTRLLRYKLADQSIPQEDLVLVSVPYAMYAQDLATPLKSEQIMDGTIRIEDLHEDLVAHIEGLTTTKTDSLMAVHKSEASAHDATKISVNNRFNHLPGTNLQEVLQGLDYAIETRKQASLIVEREVNTETAQRTLAVTDEAGIRQLGDTTLQSGLTQEIADRTDADAILQNNISAEATARTAADTTLQSGLTQEIADRTTGDSDLQSNISAEVTARADADTAHAALTVAHGSDGNVVGANTLNQVIVPIGTIVPFYDFGLPNITFDTNYWAYCDGRIISNPDSPLNGQATPDLSNRYLVGFGTEAGENIDTAAWATDPVGNTNHQIDLEHSHTVNSHTHGLSTHTHTVSAHSHDLSNHTHNGPSHRHTGPSHVHTITDHQHQAGGLFAQIGINPSLDGIFSRELTVPSWTPTKGDNVGGNIGNPGANNISVAAEVGGQTGNIGGPSIATGSGGTDNTGLGGNAATSIPSTNTSGSASPATSGPSTDTSGGSSPGTNTQLSATQSIQPRSIRVRYIMRIR